MPSTERIPVEATVLRWARLSAGLDSAGAARKISISEATLEKWEAGELEPTIKQLRDAARVYRRPLAVLLLPEPPLDFAPLADFRRAAIAGTRPAWSPALIDEYRRALDQRAVMLEINPPSVVEPDDLDQLIVGHRLDPEDMGLMLRSVLGLDLIEPRIWSQASTALRAVITTAEDLDVLVIQTQGIDPEEASGFSVADRPFPVVALNGSDVPRRRLYTLMHELAHLMISTGGLCDMHEERSGNDAADDAIEQYCNAVAAAALMPADQVLAESAVRAASPDHAWSLAELDALSGAFGASSEAVLLRLVELGAATWDLYWIRKPQLRARYRELLDGQREERRLRRQEGLGGGPNFYRVKARDLGHAYVAEVVDALNSRTISSLDAADYLEVRFDQIPRLRAEVRAR